MNNRTFSTLTAGLCLFLVLVFQCAAFAEGAPALTLDQTELTIVKGKSQKLTVSLENVENPKKVKVAWESSDPNVAAVDHNGGVRAKDGGSAEIICTATLEDGGVLTASASVTVTVPVQSVKIQTKANTAVPFGESLQLEFAVQPDNATDKTVTWQSSDEDVLRVDENGNVTAISAGKASITGTTTDGKSAKIALYVPTLAPSADAFQLTAAENIYHFTYCGDDFDKNIQINTKGNCFDYSLIRNDPDIGVVLTALAPGEGTLTVTDKKDSTAKFTVKITVTEDALPPGKQLRIDDASFDPDSGILTVKWTNTASVAATGTEFRIDPLNADGEPVVIGEGYAEDILLEERVLHTAVTAEPGKTVTATFQAGSEYPDATVMNVAVDRIEWTEFTKDGAVLEQSVLELPDDRMCWYSPQQNAYLPGPENGTPYAMPAEDVLDAAVGVHLGITTIPVPGELADAYGFAYGGMMIVSVEEDSAADTIGLEPWDLIYSVNGIRYAEEPFFIALGCAEIAAGRPVTILFERENELWEATLKPEQ